MTENSCFLVFFNLRKLPKKCWFCRPWDDDNSIESQTTVVSSRLCVLYLFDLYNCYYIQWTRITFVQMNRGLNTVLTPVMLAHQKTIGSVSQTLGSFPSGCWFVQASNSRGCSSHKQCLFLYLRTGTINEGLKRTQRSSVNVSQQEWGKGLVCVCACSRGWGMGRGPPVQTCLRFYTFFRHYPLYLIFSWYNS